MKAITKQYPDELPDLTVLEGEGYTVVFKGEVLHAPPRRLAAGYRRRFAMHGRGRALTPAQYVAFVVNVCGGIPVEGLIYLDTLAALRCNGLIPYVADSGKPAVAVVKADGISDEQFAELCAWVRGVDNKG